MTGMEAFILPALMSAGTAATTAATAAAPYAAVAGTGLGVLGTLAQADAEKAGYKAQAAENMKRANQEMITASQKAEQEQKKKEYLISQQRARFGASGAGTGGTAAEMIGESEAQGDLNTELQLWQGTTRSNAYLDEAKMKLADAKQVSKTLPLKIGSQIVSGITGMAKSSTGGSAYGDGSSLIDSSFDPDSGFYTNTYKSSPYRYGS